jgi:Spy/CpxP family protein refolding chaperone
MRTHRNIMIVALVLVVLTALVGASVADEGGRGKCGGGMGPEGAALKPAFTAEQQGQMEKVRAKYDDQRVELRNKLGVIQLAMRDLLAQPEPDFGKVEGKIDEMSAIHAKLAKLRFQQHVEIRGLLTAEQRTLFDRAFADACSDGRGGPGGCRMDCSDGMECGGKMGGGEKMGCGGEKGKMECGGEKVGAGAAGAMGCGAAKTCGAAGAAGCAAMGAGAGAASCPATGGNGPLRGTKPQAGEWRRWL